MIFLLVWTLLRSCYFKNEAEDVPCNSNSLKIHRTLLVQFTLAFEDTVAVFIAMEYGPRQVVVI